MAEKMLRSVLTIEQEYNTAWDINNKYNTIYEMTNTDPEIYGLLNGIKDPIITALWKVDANGADKLETDIVTDMVMNRWDLPSLIEKALYFLDYGYMIFEKKFYNEHYYYVDLLERMPYSFIKWEYDFAETKIVQGTQQVGGETKVVPFKKLLVITNHRDSLSPEGHSILRPLYKSHILSQQVEVAAADGMTRNLMGIPTAAVPAQISKDDEDKILEELQALESKPNAAFIEKGGVELHIKGVEGNLPDPNALLTRFANEKVASQSAELLNLSTSNRGSRAAGTSLAPLYYMRVAAIAQKVVTALNSVINELGVMNFNSIVHPKLVCSGISAKDVVEKLYALAQVKDLFGGKDISSWLLDVLEIPNTENIAVETAAEPPKEEV